MLERELLEKIVVSLDEVKNEIKEVKQRLDKVEQRLDKVEQRLDGLEQKVEIMDKEIYHLKQLIQENTQSINTLYNGFAFLMEFRTEINNFKEQMAQFQQEFTSRLDSFSDTLKILQKMYGKHEFEIEYIKEKLGITI